MLAANADGDAAVADLRQAGVEVARVVDARAGGDIVRSAAVRGARGAGGRRRTIECDLVVTATGWTAPTSLLNMAGDRPPTTRAPPGSSPAPCRRTCWPPAASPATAA